MKDRGIEVYLNNTKASKKQYDRPFKFRFNFDRGPKIDTLSGTGTAIVKFKEGDNSPYIYTGETKKGLYTKLFRKWLSPWMVEVYQEDELIYSADLDRDVLMGSKINVHLDSSSLGDTIAWIPVIHMLIEKYDCDLYVNSWWNELLSIFYPDIRFHPPVYREKNTSAYIGVGWYEEDNVDYHKRDPRTISLQQVAGDQLGINVDGDVLFPDTPGIISNSSPSIDGKYVCIALDSTANAKHWHYPGGWQSIIDYLNSIGYKVVVVQKQEVQLEGIVDKTGDVSILDRAVDIYHSDFFIGIGSGLSWLAWALKKPVVMISGFSLPSCEFEHLNYRVINRGVCHGCFNDPGHKFDKGDWNWCPRLKETPDRFICTTSITPEMVIDKIDLLMQENNITPNLE
jgi:autotransporter strand-loop-strand O-heptosyltransferase